MGSIAPFPRKRRTTARPALARQSAISGSESASLRVRAARLEDFAAIRALPRFALPALPPWTLKQFENHRRAFPEGQLVAIAEAEAIGVASCLVVRWEDYSLSQAWRAATGDGFFTTHDPAESTLYVAQMALSSARHGLGAARALYQAQRKLCRKLGLSRIVAPLQLRGFAAVAREMTPAEYALRVVCGDCEDAPLGLAMVQGFRYCGVMADCVDEDRVMPTALVAWLNPTFAPGEPPADMQAQRLRKCA